MSILLDALKKAEQTQEDLTKPQPKAEVPPSVANAPEEGDSISREELSELLLHQKSQAEPTPQGKGVDADEVEPSLTLNEEGESNPQELNGNEEPQASEPLSEQDKDDALNLNLSLSDNETLIADEKEENTEVSDSGNSEDNDELIHLNLVDPDLLQNEDEVKQTRPIVPSPGSSEEKAINLQLTPLEETPLEDAESVEEFESGSSEASSDALDNAVISQLPQSEENLESSKNEQKTPFSSSDGQIQANQPSEHQEVSRHESERHTLEVETTHLGSDTESKPSTQDSFDWSLSQIPGYQDSLSEGKPADRPGDQHQGASEGSVAMPFSSQNAKKFLGFFSQAKNSKGGRKQSSIKIWVILLFSLISVAIFYWGLDYYLQLEEENQREIAQYDRKLQQDEILIKEADRTKSSKLFETKAPKPIVNSSAEPLKTNKTVIESTNVKKTQAKEEKPRPEISTQRNAAALEARKKSNLAAPTASRHSTTQKASNAPKVASPASGGKSKPPAQQKETLSQGSAQVHSAVNAKLKGYEALTRGDYAKAQQWYQKAALQHPNDVDVWLGLGASSLALGENEKARLFYQKALEIDPFNAEAKKAVLMLSPAQDSQWVSQVQSLLEQYTDDGDLYFMLGNYFGQQQDWVNAKNAYFKALSLRGENSALLLNLAVAEDHLGEYRSALQYYQKALSYGEHALNKMQLNAIKDRLITLDRFLKAQQSPAYEDEE